MKQPWCIEVSYQDENPGTFGPYTETQARRLAAKLNEEAELASDAHGGNHHPHGVYVAVACPLTRYEDILTGEQRRQARRDARAAERAMSRRRSESEYQ